MEVAEMEVESNSEELERVQEGQYLVVQRGDYQRVILFQSQQTIIFGKGSMQQDIQLKNALGQEYYSAFRVLPLPPDEATQILEETTTKSVGKHRRPNPKGGVKKLYYLEKINQPASKSFSQIFETPSTVPSGRDNRNIVDDKMSQPLGQSDIHSLRDQGLSSQEIVSTIITSSKSFAQKTEFSQEKYLKKKEKVHGDVLIFLKPDLLMISEFFFKKDPLKILGLRPDSISQILSYANIHANGSYIIYENANSLLVAAILQRMGGLGKLLHCHAGTNPQTQAMSYLNLSPEVLRPLRNLDVFYLISGRDNKDSQAQSSNGASIKEIKCDADLTETDLEEPVTKKSKSDNGEFREDNPETKDKAGKLNSNRADNERSLEIFNTSQFHGLIICGREHPLTIFQRLLSHLALSCPFVIFSSYPEPLTECYTWIKEKSLGINMQIVDNWLRNIQVETDRTHPEINMSSSGGYILFGIYVNNT